MWSCDQLKCRDKLKTEIRTAGVGEAEWSLQHPREGQDKSRHVSLVTTGAVGFYWSAGRLQERRARFTDTDWLTDTTPASLSPPDWRANKWSMSVTNIDINQQSQSPVASLALHWHSCPGGGGGGGGDGGNVCLATVQTRWRVEGVQTSRHKGRGERETRNLRLRANIVLPRFTLNYEFQHKDIQTGGVGTYWTIIPQTFH